MNPSLAALTCTLYLGISMALKSPHNFFKLKLKNPKSVTKIQISLIINVIYQSPVVFWFYCNFAAVSVMMPITMAATPNREKRSSFQEGGAVIVFSLLQGTRVVYHNVSTGTFHIQWELWSDAVASLLLGAVVSSHQASFLGEIINPYYDYGSCEPINLSLKQQRHIQYHHWSPEYPMLQYFIEKPQHNAWFHGTENTTSPTQPMGT